MADLEHFGGVAIAKFDDPTSGNFNAGAPITIYIKGTSTKADLFNDVGGTSAKQNPFNAGDEGEFDFYASAHYYEAIVNEGAAEEFTLETIQLGPTPSNQTILNNADAGGIGKTGLPGDNFQLSVLSGFYRLIGDQSDSDKPDWATGNATVNLLRISAINALRAGDIAISSNGENSISFRGGTTSGPAPWVDIWHAAGTGRTAASAAQVIDDAEKSNVGKEIITSGSIGDHDLLNFCGFSWAGGGDLNNPVSGRTLANLSICTNASDKVFELTGTASGTDTLAFIRHNNAGVWQPFVELLTEGNTGVLGFTTTVPSSGDNAVNIRKTDGRIDIANDDDSTQNVLAFYNLQGVAGNVQTNGAATSYNESSDARLKSKFEPFSAADAWRDFDAIFGTMGNFSFKTNKTFKEPGFSAHALIDAGFTNIASEGDGPRDMEINATYKTIPAVVETRIKTKIETIEDKDTGKASQVEVEVIGEDGQPKTEQVITREAINLPVTPAMVDKSKAVPYLFPVIDDLRKQLATVRKELAELKAQK